MKPGPLLFGITAIVIFLQLILGGLLTFNFISPEPHIILGFIVFILAIATMVVTLVSKPAFRPVRIVSIGLVFLIVVQIILGFATLDSGSQLIAFVHFLNALVIYGATMGGIFLAMRWSSMAKGASHKAERPLLKNRKL
jgi:predicted membrane protein